MVTKFRRFLDHKTAILETDCNALQYYLNHPRQLGKIGRWISTIFSLQFDIKHVKGANNSVADCLSRLYEAQREERSCPDSLEVNCENVCGVLLGFSLAFGDFKEHQRKDPTVSHLLEEVEKDNAHPHLLH